jgi:hypothetical protein
MANELNTERRQVERLQKLAREREAAMNDFIQGAMRVPQGRVFFYELLAMCKIGVNPFTTHALTTAFNCGERNIGDQIQARLTVLSPNLYLQMLKEQQELIENGPERTASYTASDASDTSSGAAGDTASAPNGPFDD